MAPYPDYPLPEDEEARLRALERILLLETPSDPHLDRIVRLASTTLGMPIGLISLVDQNRQWFLSRTGIDACETPREMAFCAHAIITDEVMVIPDASEDGRFNTNPLVIGEPNIRFYAGAPVKSADGQNLGTLCLIDQQTHGFSDEQREVLKMFAEQVSREIEFRQVQSHCAVTGLWKREAFLGLSEKEFQRAIRTGNRLHLLYFDHRPPPAERLGGGSESAEQGIRGLAAGWQTLCGPADLLGRMADRMFALLLVNTSTVRAMDIARSLCAEANQFNQSRTGHCEAGEVHVGVTAQESTDLSIADMLVRAENALYLTMDEDADQIMRVQDTENGKVRS
ncbi:GAF domain-containing protein [Cyanobium gracile]|uniref:GAF domain-containing protein n=1 Tax=Cyanobium gracile UHCC 0281 TaxID=3110309 RepID=A0ABU5SU40_9CYAN|nr:GAF domain-containing protein [Cyanobium gracile]MEA5442015.1 GAF domain-containing protein [Cyanobium gracile UHCC 0281]